MADIAMCVNSRCHMRDRCYRYTAIPTEGYQAFSDFKPDEKTGLCDNFWDNEWRRNAPKE